MPIYEYQCSKCGDVFEARQKISDDPLTIHEECGGDVKRLISNTSFVLKGSGWYKTDYASGNGKGSGGADTAKPDKADKTEKSSPADSAATGSGSSASSTSD